MAGNETAFNQVEEILKASYSTVMFTGELGTAMIPKVVSNMLCCIQVIALGEVMMVGKRQSIYFLHFKKVGTLNWARTCPADASSTSHANEGPAWSALSRPMAYRPWALAELTRPFVDTGRLIVIRRKLPSNCRSW